MCGHIHACVDMHGVQQICAQICMHACVYVYACIDMLCGVICVSQSTYKCCPCRIHSRSMIVLATSQMHACNMIFSLWRPPHPCLAPVHCVQAQVFMREVMYWLRTSRFLVHSGCPIIWKQRIFQERSRPALCWQREQSSEQSCPLLYVVLTASLNVSACPALIL